MQKGRFSKENRSKSFHYGMILVWILAAGGWDQEVLETEPLLASVFPLEERERGVFLPQSILIGQTVIPAGSQLRILYMLPQKSDPETRAEAIRHQQESAYSRKQEKMQQETPPEILAALKLRNETVWIEAQRFRLKLANQNTSDLRLVYQMSPGAKIQEVVLGFVHGLFLGEKEGRVMVLAMEKRSSAMQVGFQVSDQIVTVGGNEVRGGLVGYHTLYQSAKAKVEVSPSRDLTFGVNRADGSEKILTIKIAPSLNSSIWDHIK